MRIRLFFILSFYCFLTSCKKQPDVIPAEQEANYTFYGCDLFTYYALDASTGVKRWEYKPGDMVGEAPKLYKGLFYGSDDQLFALDAATGQKRWEFSGGTTVLTIADDVLYTIGVNNKVFALDALTGKKRWEYALDDRGSAYIFNPIVVDGVVYIGSFNDKHYALDANTGTLKWVIEDYYLTSPLRSFQIRNGLLHTVLYQEKKIKTYDLLTGKIRWESELDNPLNYAISPVFDKGTMYVVDQRKLIALNTSTGHKLWEFTGYDLDSAPTLYKGVLYATNGIKLLGIDAASGQKVQESRLPTTGRFLASPIVDDGVVYLSEFNSICALEIGSGKVKWHLKTNPMGMYNHPIFANGLIYRTNTNTYKFYAVDVRTGIIKWESPATAPIAYPQLTVEKN